MMYSTLPQRILPIIAVLTGLLCCGLIARSEDRPAEPTSRPSMQLLPIFSDHMVLQRGMSVPIWGNALPGEAVDVSVAGKGASATADATGKWSVKIGPLDAGGPFQMTISSPSDHRVLDDVLVGDVWLCSGQSNMAWAVVASKNGEQESAQANYPQLRLMSIKKGRSALKPLTDLPADVKWDACTPATVKLFSAAGYFLGRDLQQHLNVPIGLIDNSEGSTPAESWLSREALLADPDLAAISKRGDELDAFAETAAGKTQLEKCAADYDALQKVAKAEKKWVWRNDTFLPPQSRLGHPNTFFNARVNPLIPFAIKGVIWYQGEANTARGIEYRKLFPALIADWRQRWGQGDFPFLFVQLAGWARTPAGDPVPSDWAEIREAQLLTLKASPNTRMAVTVDIGDVQRMHPLDKQDVGARLALAARDAAYGEKIVCSGPLYRSSQVDGGKIRLSFDSIGGGLVAKDGPLKTFTIAGEDQKFYWANAEIDGDSILVSAEQVKAPVAVRYAWSVNPEGCNLYNSEGLPASPFRTDDWPGYTEKHGMKYQLGAPIVFKAKPTQ